MAPRPDDVATIDGMAKAYYEVVTGPAGQPQVGVDPLSPKPALNHPP